MTLEDEMKKYETIKYERCESCGNQWFFQRPISLKCTTCGTARIQKDMVKAVEHLAQELDIHKTVALKSIENLLEKKLIELKEMPDGAREFQGPS